MLTRKQRLGRRKAQLQNEQEKQQAIAAGWRMVLSAINDSMVIASAALHDEFGFGETRTNRFLDRFGVLFEACIQEDMLDVENIETELKKEGIKCIDAHKYEFFKIEKEAK
jgi:L-amino acid N-acyltransferase YncA